MLPVLGVEVMFVSNAPRLLAMIEAEYGHWRDLSKYEDLVSSSDAVVRIRVDDLREGLPLTMPTDSTVRYGVPEPTRMELRGPMITGTADSGSLQSRAHLGGPWLEQPARLVREIVEPLTLFLLGALDRVPLHAAGIVRDDVGIVLAGPSGVGKSTLAMVATRAGFAPLADDPVYVQLEPRLRIWGWRRHIHLTLESRKHFPEFADLEPTRMPNGKLKLIVDAGAGRRFVERTGLCVLRRGSAGRPRLTQITAERAREEVTARLDPGFHLFRGSIERRVELIARGGAWLLELGSDPWEALPLLSEGASSVEGDG